MRAQSPAAPEFIGEVRPLPTSPVPLYTRAMLLPVPNGGP
jgi:hypothetical protein